MYFGVRIFQDHSTLTPCIKVAPAMDNRAAVYLYFPNPRQARFTILVDE